MSRTIRQLIISAYQTTGRTALGEIPENEEISWALTKINGIISSVGLDAQFPFVQSSNTFNMTSNDGSYTIGLSGQDITLVRPQDVLSASFLSGGVLYPIEKISPQDFDTAVQDTNLSGYPKYFCYRGDMPNSTIQFYPKPNSNYPCTIVFDKLISEYDLNDVISLPNGYDFWLEWALCGVIAIATKIDPTAYEIKAEQALARVKRLNQKKQRSISSTLSGRGGENWNIYTGTRY